MLLFELNIRRMCVLCCQKIQDCDVGVFAVGENRASVPEERKWFL